MLARRHAYAQPQQRTKKPGQIPCPAVTAGGEEAIYIYGTDQPEAAPFIYRSLSLVPDEAKGLIALGAAQYLEIENFMDLDFSYDPEITRAEVEVVAGRVSAINQCFY